jgi:predicted acylesterase/phospholipase RssA
MSVRLRKPLGLVLSGGGAHGAWQAGVIEKLHYDFGLRFDHIVSFSIGSLTGAAYFLDRLAKLNAIWKNISGHRILRFSPKLAPISFYSNAALWEVLRHVGSDEHARSKASCKLTSIAYCVDTKKHVYSHFSPNGQAGWDGPLTSRLMASCSIPKVFPPIEIQEDLQRTRTYIDGGVDGNNDSNPLNFETLAGCKDVLVIQMTRPEEIGKKPPWGYLSRRLQSAREGLHGAISLGLKPLKALHNRPRIFRLYPTRILEYSMLKFDSRVCIPALFQGAHDAEYFMKDLASYEE